MKFIQPLIFEERKLLELNESLLFQWQLYLFYLMPCGLSGTRGTLDFDPSLLSFCLLFHLIFRIKVFGWK